MAIFRRASAPLDKQAILNDINFGHGTAESEVDHLASYFVETTAWSDVFQGRDDFVFGPKGSGKSAIYALLLSRKKDLQKRGIMVVGAENLRGEPVFSSLPKDEPLTQTDFIFLWKLYFLTLIGYALRGLPTVARSPAARQVIHVLEEEGLLAPGLKPWDLGRILAAVVQYMKRMKRISLSGQVVVPAPVPWVVAGKITFEEPSEEQKASGQFSVNHLFHQIGMALAQRKLTVWLVIDRLDVAFSGDAALETTALSALFQAYSDLSTPAYRLAVKVFLRTDILERLSKARKEPAPESSRIEGITLSWNEKALLNLVVRRFLAQRRFTQAYRIDVPRVRRDFTLQEALFRRLFPPTMQDRETSVECFQWILSHTCDGTGQTEPRELILLLNYVRQRQLANIDIGASDLPGDQLFDEASLRSAMLLLSRQRLNNTLLSEFPDIEGIVRRLEGTQAEHTLDDLARIWRTRLDEARSHANRLVEVGFFEKQLSDGIVTFRIPPLYQVALHISEW